MTTYEQALTHSGLTPDVRHHQMYLQGQAAGMAQAREAMTHGCPPDCKDGMIDSGGIHPWGEAALVPCPNCKAITAHGTKEQP